MLLSILVYSCLLGMATAIRSCSSCDAGASCNMCLNLVAESECPMRGGSDMLSLARDCDNVAIGGMCEADGECGTNDDADNCPSGWSRDGGRDVYKREECIITTPQAPPPPPSPPLATCESLQCDAGASCGICLQKLSPNSADCPAWHQASFFLKTCDEAEPGELCEADGECGTVEVDNCPGMDRNPGSAGRRLQKGGGGDRGGGGGGMDHGGMDHGGMDHGGDHGEHHDHDHPHGGSGGGRPTWGSSDADIYRRVACAYPPSPPTPPAPPPIPCDKCDAGSSCGLCLVLVDESECPSSWFTDVVLPTCDLAERGRICEADGECGTSNSADNCRGADGDTGGGGPSWRKRKADVYRLVDCGLSGSSQSPADASSSSPPPPASSSGGGGPEDHNAGGGGGSGGVDGGVVFLLMLISWGCGMGVLVAAFKSGKCAKPLRMVGLAPSPPTPVISTHQVSPVVINHGATGMAAPLATNAAPVGTYQPAVAPPAPPPAGGRV